jgi:hypothetical protein
MKNLLKITILAAALSACSSDNIPTPQKLGHDIQTLPPATGIAAVSMEKLAAPRDAQIIEKQTTFKVLDNIYSETENRVIVRRGAIISGTYTNDGTECKIVWNSIYVNKSEYKDKKGTPSLGSIAEPTQCDPVKGVKKGQRAMIRVNNEFLD